MKIIKVRDIVYHHKRFYLLINKDEATRDIFKRALEADLLLEEENVQLPIRANLVKRYELQGRSGWILESKSPALYRYANYPYKNHNVYLNIKN